MEKFYCIEWKRAEKEGNLVFAEACKQIYRSVVMERIKRERPYNEYLERLKKYPPIYLN